MCIIWHNYTVFIYNRIRHYFLPCLAAATQKDAAENLSIFFCPKQIIALCIYLSELTRMKSNFISPYCGVEDGRLNIISKFNKINHNFSTTIESYTVPLKPCCFLVSQESIWHYFGASLNCTKCKISKFSNKGHVVQTFWYFTFWAGLAPQNIFPSSQDNKSASFKGKPSSFLRLPSQLQKLR